MYYVSKRLLDAETRYLELEKLALALLIISKKLRLYFHTHLIEDLTNYLLRQVLQKPKASGRLLKWAIKSGQFYVNYRPYTVIKGQAFTDFIAEFTYSETSEVAGTIGITEAMKGVETKKGRTYATESEDNSDDVEQLTLYVDNVRNENRSGAGMMLISPEGHKIHCALRFEFQASNNEAEYEVLITGL